MLLKFWVIVNALDCFLTDSVDDHCTSVINDAWFFTDEEEARRELSRVNLDRLPWQNEYQLKSFNEREE